MGTWNKCKGRGAGENYPPPAMTEAVYAAKARCGRVRRSSVAMNGRCRHMGENVCTNAMKC